MATFTFDGSTCLQSLIDQARNNNDPSNIINFDASAFPAGGAVMASDNPCPVTNFAANPPTWDGSSCTGYGGAVANLDGIRNLTINGNGVRIINATNSNWTVGIHDTNNVTINDLIIRQQNNVNQDSNAAIFATKPVSYTHLTLPTICSV